MDIQDIGWEIAEGIRVAQGRDQWRSVVGTEIDC